MIGRLTGVVIAEEGDGGLVIDVAGVGYEVAAPLGTLGRARTAGDGDRVTLHVHTHVREDALALFGFATPEDKAAFRTLVSLSNVGPKIALAVLSALDAGELARVVARQDRAALHGIPGVGKKTAERLLLELKDKLVSTSPGVPAPAPRAPGAGPSRADQLAGALAHMGFRPAQVERALGALAAGLEAEPLDQLIRQALGLLS